MKRNKYEPEIDEFLDLHQLNQSQAQESVENFLRTCEKRGYKRVCIITGKGLHSSQGAVLKPWLSGYLWDQGYVFRDAKIQEGGRGALVITLKG